MSIKYWLLLCLLALPVVAQAKLPIQHWVTPEGARVFFVESRQLPMLDIAVSFPAGSARDPARQPGLAQLTHSLLDQGAGGLSDSEIAHRMADVGAVLSGSFDRDRAAVNLRTLSSEAEKRHAFDIYLRVLQQPDFPQAVIAREIPRVIAAIREAQADPGSVASKAFYAALYGQHPYAHDLAGEQDAVRELTRADFERFYRAHYSAPNAVIAMIGDLNREQAERMAASIAAGLPAGEPVSRLAAPVAAAPAIHRIAHPSTQSHVLIGTLGIARGDPDFFPLFVGNYVLGGGGFDSRLMREIRDQRGFAYSVYSFFLPLSEAGPFLMGLQTQVRQADEAHQVAVDMLRDFIAKGPTEAEVQQARNNLVGGFPLRLDSNRKILDQLSLIGFYRLPLDHLDTWVGRVEAVTAADVQAAFARRLNPDALTTVVVGSGDR